MSVAKVTEVIVESEKSFEDALKIGIDRANKTLKKVRSVWIKDQSVSIENGKISSYRLILKVTFVLND